ncbi:uncharacterized protein [Dendrobates tinctorius]|uniref:uncharacterized protein n=1 Tax=Dendrobates tinctorius TaxID=92724 RepID=UPI003CC96132
MDFKARELSWQGRVKEVFCNSGTTTMVTSGSQFNSVFNVIKNLTHKRIRFWWNRAFLENYIERQLIPRGLRVHVTPSFIVSDQEFISNWESVCNDTSKKLMELLIKLNINSLAEIDKSLEEAYTSAKANLSTDQLQLIGLQLDKHIEQWIKDIQVNQSNKLMRDQRDFNLGRVYRWRKNATNENNGDRQHNRNPSMSSNPSVSDISGASTSASVSTSIISTPKRKRDVRYQPMKRLTRYTPDNNLKVINLSTHIFSPVEINLLNKGLMFCPTPLFDQFTAIKDLNLFARKLLFKRHFHDETIFQLFPTEAEQEALDILDNLANDHNTLEKGTMFLPFLWFE